jgi:hypothetical protein
MIFFKKISSTREFLCYLEYLFTVEASFLVFDNEKPW